MQYSLLSLAFAALALASPAPQGVTSAITPSSTAPAGCSSSYNGQFEIELVNVTKSSKRDIAKRAALVVTLSNGVLTDSQGRTGYIAANYQFQFDKPPQTGAIYTAGFSACSNGSLAIGNDAIFYECLSGTFYNIYDESVGAQCAPVYIDIIAVGSGSAPASVISDGQVTGTPVSQISDGQPQATGAVSQISDGQVQGPTGNPVTQISDGQPQGPTGAPVTQISDGQVQGPTGHPVTQISDGQIQGPTATAVVSPVSQISDGQPQAPVATGTGKPAPSGNSTSPSTPSTAPVTPSGNSATGMSALGGAAFAFVAMLAAAAFL